MQATTETRRTLLFIATLLMAPPILWGGFGLVERLTPRRGMPYRESTSQWEYQQDQKVRLIRDRLKWVGRKKDWGQIPIAIQREFGSDCPPDLLPLRAEAHWRLGNRKKAVADWDRYFGATTLLAKAESLALQGDRKGYSRACASLLALPPAEGAEANNRAWVMVLLPDGLKDYRPAVALAEIGVAQAKTTQDRSLYLNTLGVALLRAGRLKEALAQLQLSEKLHSQPANWPFFSLLYKKLNQPEQAKRWKQALEDYLNQSYANSTDPRHELLLFQKEL